MMYYPEKIKIWRLAPVIALLMLVSLVNMAQAELCPLCNIEFATFDLPETGFVQVAIDGRPIGTKPAPLPECPLCGVVFSESGFSDNEKSKLEKIVWSAEYQKNRKAATWLRLALIKEKLGRSSIDLAQAWLEAAWSMNGDRQALLKSADYFENYLAIAPDSENNHEVRLKIADIYRQLGDFEKASAMLKKIKPGRESTLNSVLRLEAELIQEENTASVAVPDGNELHRAILADNLEECRRLAKNVELLNEKNRQGLTPLLLATSLSKPIAMKILISNGANLAGKTPSGMTAMQIATRNAFIDGILLLFKAGASTLERDPGGNNLLHLICAGNSQQREAALKFLLRQNIDVNQRNFADLTPLHVVCQSGSENMLRLLVKYGAKIDARLPDGSSALFICRDELILPLIELGANLEIVGNNGLTAFSTALLSGKARRIDEFKKTGKFGRKLTENPDAMELWQHVRSGAIEQTAASIQHNPSLVGFKEAALGESALHLAILTNQEKIVELLLNNGANPDLRNDFGRTALHYAAMKGDIKLTKLLVDAKANIFALDIRGSTPLHEAAAAGATDVYHYLNKLGASDSTKNNSGFSARELYEKTTSN